MPKKKNISRLRYIYTKYGRRCAYCGIELDIDSMHVDHIIPKNAVGVNGISKEDVNDISNLNPSCKKCNSSKKDMPLNYWREILLKGLIDTLDSNAKFVILQRLGCATIKLSPVVFHFETYSKN